MPAARLRNRCAAARTHPYPPPASKHHMLQLLQQVARIQHKPVINEPPPAPNYAAAANNMKQLCATASERVMPQNHVITFSIHTEDQLSGAEGTPSWHRAYYTPDSWAAVGNRRIAIRAQLARARDVPLTDVSPNDPELVKRMRSTSRDAPRLVINLQLMVGRLRAAAANKENFRCVPTRASLSFSNEWRSAAIVWTMGPSTTALAFGSARLVCTGAKSVADARTAAGMYVEIFKRAIPLKLGMFNFAVQNVVCNMRTEFLVRLADLHAAFPNVSVFDPQLFPGLIFRMKLLPATPAWAPQGGKMPKWRACVLLFRSGRGVITGVKSVEEAREAFQFFVNRIACNYHDKDSLDPSSAHYRTRMMNASATATATTPRLVDVHALASTPPTTAPVATGEWPAFMQGKCMPTVHGPESQQRLPYSAVVKVRPPTGI